MNRRLLSVALSITAALQSVVLLTACHKDFLEKSPTTALVVISSLADCQKILENTAVTTGTPLLGDISSDNIYLTDDSWSSTDSIEHNAYMWAPDIFQGHTQIADWDAPYQQVFYANVTLEGLASLGSTTASQQQWNFLQGWALFLRAHAFFQVSQIFAPPYDSASATSALGIPLRLHSEVSSPSVRASLAATYQQIIADLQAAAQLLPDQPFAQNPNRPSKPAAYGLLARVYLSMRQYTNAGRYADSALRLYSTLMDYATLGTQNSLFPFNALNPEILYQNNIVDYTQCLAAIIYPGTIIDSALYASYDPQDLRRSYFFTPNASGQPNMKPSYAQSVWPFTGITTDELYLIRAECSARQHKTAAALNDLDTLLVHRFPEGQFVPITVTTWQQALDTILVERRKELPLRGLRWSDLRRLNLEGRNIVLTRRLNGIPYHLIPNSNLYTFPIPPDVLEKNPGMQQNPR